MFSNMYSPKISKHTPILYRIAREIGKPMTKVADDLITYGCLNLKSIYEEIDEERIAEILCANSDCDCEGGG